MADPYRDGDARCPACGQTLRPYQARLVCDACTGMFVPLGDLAAAICDLTSLTPTLEIAGAAPGKRACPRCTAPMATCKLVIRVDEDVAHPRVALDHCGEHGLWFDADKLAAVLETIAGKGFGIAGSGSRKGSHYGGAAGEGGGTPNAFGGGRGRFGGHGPL